MAITLTDQQVMAWLDAYLWPFLRVAALFSVAPVLGTQITPVRVRIILAVLVTTVIAPLAPPVHGLDPLSPQAMVVAAQQVLIGLALGFALRLVFSALEMGAQAIALQMGLGFAELMDPQSGVNAPTLSHFYGMVGTLVFLTLDGHHRLLELLAQSFAAVPSDGPGLGPAGFWAVAAWGSTMFQGAVMVALPAMAALLAANLVMGVMTRAVPQFNLFIAFPIMLLLGLLAVLFSLPGLAPQLEGLILAAEGLVREALGS